MHGRAIRASLFSGHPAAVTYVIAEPDRAAAIRILRAGLQENYDQFEDLGHVSENMLAALNLKAGGFTKA
jgi:hypothetical protein